MNRLILVVFAVLVIWIIKRDIARREGISRAIWIPTLWVGILASRQLSAWLGFGGAEDTLDGSPVDRLFFLSMIVAALLVLSRRRVEWGRLFSRNWPILLFYAFLLVSVVWANSPLTSLKRWIKEFGNIIVLLVILSEVDPLQAFRAVFVRCAYVLIPLSIIFIRYFPELGRRYSIHTGGMEPIGVTVQKNSLGEMVLVCGLVLLWDWLERSRPEAPRQERIERYLPPTILAIGAWLLKLSDSMTSTLCLIIGSIVMLAIRLPLLHRRIDALGRYVLLGVVGFFSLNWMFGITDSVVASMGRDMTFTGRANVWQELLKVHTDPLLGTGFMSFWDDAHYQAILPNWVDSSAHNGYLEIYLAGGFIGVAFLAVMLLATGVRINRALAWGSDYAVVRFAIFIAMLLASFTESNFACMTSLGFLFLLAAIGYARPEAAMPGLGEPRESAPATAGAARAVRLTMPE
ncbi:MAG TPA: O-antigen ligase family protein [Verrucomicrobiae bacterium]|nr:O-antigen ligase family protein [Verrucomicrobiae bacterium]